MRRSRLIWMGAAVLLAACAGRPAPEETAPAAEPAATEAAPAQADTAALAPAPPGPAAADSIARAQQLAARQAARAESVRAEVAGAAAPPGAAPTDVVAAPAARAAAGQPAPGAAPAPGVVAAPAARLPDEVAGRLATFIHFDFDSYALRFEAVGLLDQKLDILRQYPNLEILIAGHCDERGSDEYNLALGNRRAAAAKRYLVAHGIDEGRIEIVSFGEEQPADSGHNETAWAMNRRAEFTITAGP